MGATAIAVLGPLALSDGDGGASVPLGPRDRVVLSALAMRPQEVISAERLADALWGDRPPASWNKIVPGCVFRLRQALGPAAIETTPHGYRLTVAADLIDARRFERLVARGGWAATSWVARLSPGVRLRDRNVGAHDGAAADLPSTRRRRAAVAP